MIVDFISLLDKDKTHCQMVLPISGFLGSVQSFYSSRTIKERKQANYSVSPQKLLPPIPLHVQFHCFIISNAFRRKKKQCKRKQALTFKCIRYLTLLERFLLAWLKYTPESLKSLFGSLEFIMNMLDYYLVFLKFRVLRRHHYNNCHHWPLVVLLLNANADPIVALLLVE